jgi:hypothetical protein
MKVDRSLFLLLTGVLAGGCHIYVDEPGPRTANAPPPPPSPNQATPPTPPAPAPPPPQPGAPAQPQQRVTNVIPVHLGHSGGTPASGGTTPPAGACLDANATAVPDCGTMKAPDSTCTPFPFPQQKCTAYKTYFVPKVAAQAISCMTSLSSKQVCDATQTYGCGKAALAQACPDPAVGQLCTIAAGACKSTPADCASLISGLNDQGKQQVAQCIAQGCQAGLYSCVEGLH